MKKDYSRFFNLLLLSLMSVFIAACSATDKQATEAPIGDISGDWQVSSTDSSSNIDCDGSFAIYSLNISQSGNSLSVTGLGATLSGTISANQISVLGSYPDDGGTTTITASAATLAADCNRFSGSDSWSWTDGRSACSGTSTYTATRTTGSGCGAGTGTGTGTAVAALDTSFNLTGKIITDLGGANDHVRDLLIDANDKIIIAGENNISGSGDFALVRYNTDGSLDSGFGTNGKVITNLGGDDRGRAVAMDANGKIVFGGDSLITASDFAVVRYNKNGSLDTSFNGTGIVITDFNNTAEPAIDITIASDGKIIAAGFAHNGTDYDFAVARYNSDGSLDTSFNKTGLQTTDLGTDDRASAVVIDANGKIILAGHSGASNNNGIALVRYNGDGSIDTTFGNQGVVTFSLVNRSINAREMILDSSGKILLAVKTNNSGNNNFIVMRYNSDGSADTTFGTNGVVISDSVVNGKSRDIIIDSSGRILIVGSSGSRGNKDFAVLRYNSNGSLDSNFGTNGIINVDFGADDRGAAIALDSTGRIVVAGRSITGSSIRFAAARLLP